MKATEQYFPVVLFFKQYNVLQVFGTVDEIQMCDLQIKATDCTALHAAVALFISHAVHVERCKVKHFRMK